MLPFPAAGIVRLPLGACLIAWAIVAVLLFSAVLPVLAMVVEGRRAAADRLATSLVWTAFLVALVPLVSLLWTVLVKGAGAINGTFLTYSFYRTSMDQPVGIYHAIVGTLMITLFRSEEHTSELQSLMRISYAVFCLKQQKKII